MLTKQLVYFNRTGKRVLAVCLGLCASATAKRTITTNKCNTADYFLFFATNSLEGLEAMKHAMWKVDPAGEFQFSDFTDTSSQLPFAFAVEPDYPWLKEIIVHNFRNTEVESRMLGERPLALKRDGLALFSLAFPFR